MVRQWLKVQVVEKQLKRVQVVVRGGEVGGEVVEVVDKYRVQLKWLLTDEQWDQCMPSPWPIYKHKSHSRSVLLSEYWMDIVRLG